MGNPVSLIWETPQKFSFNLATAFNHKYEISGKVKLYLASNMGYVTNNNKMFVPTNHALSIYSCNIQQVYLLSRNNPRTANDRQVG